MYKQARLKFASDYEFTWPDFEYCRYSAIDVETNGLNPYSGYKIFACSIATKNGSWDLPFRAQEDFNYKESDVLNFTFGTDINLDYKKTYGKDTDREFGISAQYSYSNKKSDYETDQFDEVGLLNYNETSPNLGLNKEFTFAADYLHPFSKSINLEVGAKTILRNVYSDIYYDTLNIPANQYLRDHSRDNIFDYDQDGDLDMFLLNHSLPAYPRFNNLKAYLETKGKDYASKLYRNDHGKYKEVSEQAGIANNVLSFGLGLAVSDFNQDGWLDRYVSTDCLL